MILAYLTMKAICERRKDVQHYFHGGNNMNKRIVKKVVSVIACASILAGYASICNAYSLSINSGSSGYITTKTCSVGNHNYSYNVSYVLFDGCAVGAYLNGLTIKSHKGNTVLNICTVNKGSKSGSYYIPYSGSYTYKMHNGSTKHVAITFTFS